MKKLVSTIAWDLKLQTKYNILTVAVIITILYSAIFKFLHLDNFDNILITLVFSDPTMLGFIFIGAMVLFEKNSNTLEAISVTPLKINQYLISKAISLSLIALPCSIAMSIVGHGFDINFAILFLVVFLSSMIFVFLGFVGVSRVKTYNQYILVIPIFFLPICLPFLNFFNLTDCYLFYIIPTQASLLLFEAAFGKILNFWEYFYSVTYLLICLFVSFKLSIKSYKKNILENK